MKMRNKKILFAAIISVIVVCATLLVGVFAFTGNVAQSPTLEIVGKNLSFRDSVYLKYAVSAENVDDIDSVKLLVWLEPQEEYILGTQDHILSPEGTATVAEKECIIFDFKNLAAKQMTDVVYVRAYVESNGETYYSEAEKYSILTYIYNKLGYTGTRTENKDLAALLEGMLYYGASAQIYFDYKTDDLATDDHVKVTVKDGAFADGFDVALVKPGTKLTVIASNNSDKGGFLYWTDSNGKFISTKNSIEIIAGEINSSISAVYSTYTGGEIDNLGASMENDSFALTEHIIDTSDVRDVTAADLSSLLQSGLEAGAVYRVTDGQAVTISSSVNGNGATIIVPAGVKVSGSAFEINNIIVSGSISVISSSDLTFSSVDVQSSGNAITVDASCDTITIDNCRLNAAECAIITNANDTVIKSTYMLANDGAVASSNNNTVYNSIIFAQNDAITVSGADNAINNNDVVASSDKAGITVDNSSLNTLVTYNKIIGCEKAIKVSKATNTVLLLNSAYDILAENSTNTYIVENSLGGHLELENNNYLLCDSNSYTDNGEHSPSMSGNQNVNGDSLMDVTVRNEVGANEDLLPHTNKDLFLEMDRKTTVRDVANGTSYDFNTYIEENAKTNGIVIVPPGAYSTAKGDYLRLTKGTVEDESGNKTSYDMSNTVIYAFGVYNEHGFITDAEYLADPSKTPNYILRIENIDNITIHGLTNAYDYQSSGQAHVLEKLEDNQIRIIPSAGFDLDAGFGLSNPDVFSGSFYACHKGDPTPWFETSYSYVRTDSDKTIVIKLSQENYDRLAVGDILCCRMAGDNQQSIGISNSDNVLLKDCVLHGYAAALGHVVGGDSDNVKFERVHNCPKAPAVITESTYKFYSDLETNYSGVDFEMTKYGETEYRGTAPRFCSVDATHVAASSQGLSMESCLFEQMCDDGSNQRGTSSRLYGIKDNQDGTATVYIKGMVTEVYHGLYTKSDNHEKNMNPIGFSEGDNIYIYTSGGELVCDATCLSDAKSETQLAERYCLGEMTYYINVTSVTVPSNSVNFDALEGYDLKNNHYDMKNKIMVDNISRVSGNFTVDNLLIRNSWSRGILTKTVNATVKHSTFRHIKSAGILANCEPTWGESTIPRNITVEGCIFEETGFVGEYWTAPANAPIYISGLSTYGEANIHKIICQNITVKGCEFLNYGHQYGIYVDGAQNVNIIDNVFDPVDTSAPGNFVNITTAVNVEISGNKYRDASGSLSTISGISADDYTNIHGTDVEGQFAHDFDIFIAGKHISDYKIVPADKENKDIASIMSQKLKDICGYSVAATPMHYKNEIKLVVNDSESELIESNAYTVECIDGQLIITAETNSALIYAVEDFLASIANMKNNGQNTFTFEDGYSDGREFSISELISTNESIFKYTGVWNADGSAMLSGADADYVEFDFTGHSFTLLFDGETTFKISVDGANAVEYTAVDEKTFTLSDGDHSVRILCADTSKKVRFLGVKTYSSIITKTANKTKYVQFIGDSMVDYDLSFAHRAGDVLGWDYSVVVGDTLPATSVTRAPDVFVLFLGTDAVTSNSTATEINAFKTTYQNLIASITSKYSSAKVFIMQPLSTSDGNAMFDTTHKRYAAINSVKSSNTSINDNSNVQLIDATDKLINWNVEFDNSVSTTYPTINGDYTVTVKLASYLFERSGSTSYINASFPLSGMNGFQTSSVTTETENGVTFKRFCFEINGHIWLSGNDYANVSVNPAGRYLVLKYRASGEQNLRLETRTNDYGTGQPATQSMDDGTKKIWISGKNKTENNVPESWEVAVVDLSQFANYTVGLTDTKVQLRITTTSNFVDIAYAAIVDDLSEAKMAAMLELNATQYTFYEDWSGLGTDVSLNGLEIEEPIDLSYVNQEFGIIGMSSYNATKTLFFNTDEGIDYARFNFKVDGHVYITGSNNFVELTGDTGRYFIIKYRSTNDDDININALTSDYPHTDTGANMSTLIKQNDTINSGVWEVAVIDMSAFKDINKGTQYTIDADLKIWLRLTTSVSQIDIAYAAIVDDLDEANTFIKYKGDSNYVHYTNWAEVGTTETIK
ncbi:MAG: hypothetical protein J6L83_06015 [Clostridia bacterium]|nr:hypothetical protein [Clostridia bacterium]